MQGPVSYCEPGYTECSVFSVALNVMYAYIITVTVRSTFLCFIVKLLKINIINNIIFSINFVMVFV